MQECLFCKKLTKNPKFCSQSCSALFSNPRRTLSEKCKEKISNSLRGKKLSEETKEKIRRSKTGKKIDRGPNKNPTKKITRREIREIPCRMCQTVVLTSGTVKHCDNCRSYREKCKFTFNIFSFPEDFNLELLSVYGFYKAKNRGNNPNGLTRDHMFSISNGLRLGVAPEKIRHPANCQLLTYADNLKKHSKSSISLEELEKRIVVWDNTH